MTVGYQIILRAIECKKLHEGGDEIYYLLNGIEQRPAGDPDYWGFERVGQKRIVERLILEGPEGSEVALSLREQDGGLRFEHDKLGDVVVCAANRSITFVEKRGTTYLGKRRGYHVVDFHDSDGVYSLHFAARIVEAL